MEHQEIIKLVIAYTLAGAVVFTVIMTCLSLVGWIKFANPKQQNKLFYVLIVELVVISVTFFGNILRFDPMLVQNTIEEAARLCCSNVGDSVNSEERAYCLDHAIAVSMFIFKPPDTTTQRARLETAQSLFDRHIDTCSSVASVLDVVSTVPELNVMFVDEHNDANRDLDVAERDKLDLVKCGFKHALEASI